MKSLLRRHDFSALPNLMMSWSPASWPKVSLTCLKLSMSRISRLWVQPSLSVANSSFCFSSKARRLLTCDRWSSRAYDETSFCRPSMTLPSFSIVSSGTWNSARLTG